MSSLFPVLVESVTSEGARCVRLRLVARADDENLPGFEPGAHVDIMTPSGLIRQYSLCGSADDTSAYEVCIKHDNATSRGGSASLCTQVSPGMELQISSPRNAFTLPEARRYSLVAGGIGITPLLPMLLRLQRNNAEWELHYYTREPEQAPFADMLRNSSYQEHVHFRRSLREGYPDCLNIPSPDTAIMLCGPDGFMNAVSSHAVAAGWRAEQIHTEYFRPAESSHSLMDQPFEVVLARSGQTIRVQAGQSIASALLAAGIEIDLACEQGMCGACIVPLLAGVGDHRDVVLTQEEQGGHIALCCSRSRTPSLTLDL
ncbi:oxidoreductase [Novacetimonas hansenii]|uniref:Putative vanillate O-demethylase oxidoreductase n=1 Tax=Novacetimonas hansenii ATCC 23769 TaxID=714995 RepID=D5QF90_NOVHA|nr:PDR/VanB family oxidoreductase [Novacetimonas hansenii]EFG84252.1 putative vanillate O-demethylase oxidoreductase [Novacetimonas hansenii ATCC 23769]